MFRLSIRRSFKMRDISQRNGPLFREISFLSLEMFKQTLTNVIEEGFIVQQGGLDYMISSVSSVLAFTCSSILLRSYFGLVSLNGRNFEQKNGERMTITLHSSNSHDCV